MTPGDPAVLSPDRKGKRVRCWSNGGLRAPSRQEAPRQALYRRNRLTGAWQREPGERSGAEDVPAATALVVLLAAAAVSFSPPIAGRGNLIKRLWFMLAGVGVLVGLNELSKLATRALGP